MRTMIFEGELELEEADSGYMPCYITIGGESLDTAIDDLVNNDKNATDNREIELIDDPKGPRHHFKDGLLNLGKVRITIEPLE